MKNLIVFFFFLSLSSASSAQSLDLNEPFLKIENDTLDYGIIKYGSNGERLIEVKNTGEKPLIITNCTGSCGCTVPNCPSKPIQPGEKAEISIKYDTKRTGDFNKTVTIKSNAINNTVYLKVKGKVIE